MTEKVRSTKFGLVWDEMIGGRTYRKEQGFSNAKVFEANVVTIAESAKFVEFIEAWDSMGEYTPEQLQIMNQGLQ